MRLITNYQNYYVNKKGEIFSNKWGYVKRMKSVQDNPDDYCYVRLSNNNNIKKEYIHRLVLETFVGPCPEGMECCHSNGIRNDNRLNNLRWGTKKENGKDKINHNNSLKGELNHFAKLKDEEVWLIKNLLNRNVKCIDIAPMFKCDYTNISQIKRNKTWKQYSYIKFLQLFYAQVTTNSFVNVNNYIGNRL